MNRRSFIQLASGLLLPWEPERVYSFAGGRAVPAAVCFLVNGRRVEAVRTRAGCYTLPHTLNVTDRISVMVGPGTPGETLREVSYSQKIEGVHPYLATLL